MTSRETKRGCLFHMSFCENRYETIAYLADGNERQRSAYKALERLGVMQILQPYKPVLVGTVPIELDIAGSDLDIVCEVFDGVAFARMTTEHYGYCEGFRSNRRVKDALERVVINFVYEDWPIEIFGQPMPAKRQNGYKHMSMIGMRII